MSRSRNSGVLFLLILGVLAAFSAAILFISISPHNCQADDSAKLAALKKIEKSYRLERVGPKGITLTDRVITFKPGEKSLAVIEKVEGFSEESKTEIPLNEIKSEGGCLEFVYRFKGDISMSKIKVSQTGEISGESSFVGKIAVISFKS